MGQGHEHPLVLRQLDSLNFFHLHNHHGGCSLFSLLLLCALLFLLLMLGDTGSITQRHSSQLSPLSQHLKVSGNCERQYEEYCLPRLIVSVLFLTIFLSGLGKISQFSLSEEKVDLLIS